MKKEEIEAKLNTAKEDLAKMQAAVVAESGPGADVRFDLWENHAPVIHRTIKDLLADEGKMRFSKKKIKQSII